MRTFIKLFVTFMLFGLFSGSVMAGKVEVCEAIKHDPAYKGLYGLCNAYWNASERAQARILESFYIKAGPDGPGMPGLDEPLPDELVCPCWPDAEIDLGTSTYNCYASANYLEASYDFNLIQYGTNRGTDTHTCSYANFTTGMQGTGTLTITDEEVEVCAEQLMLRIVEDYEGCL